MRSIILLLILVACGKNKADESASDDKAKPAAPTSGHCWREGAQQCYEFSQTAVKAQGPAFMKAMCSSPDKLVENKPCPTEKLLGTCSAADTVTRFYAGDRERGIPAWTAATAREECKAIGPSFTFR